MAEKKRELWADYAKGICILLVFIGHSDAIPQAVRIFIYLFHMPMFFFCMGYYSSTAGTFGAFVKKRFRQLMVPFFAYGILYHVLCLGIVVPLLRGGADWALCRDNILGLLVQLRGTDLVAPKWFLTAAFVASVLFYVCAAKVHSRPEDRISRCSRCVRRVCVSQQIYRLLPAVVYRCGIPVRALHVSGTVRPGKGH